MKVKLLLAAAALFVPFATTQAASMPEGNYRATCIGATIIGSTLKATCERKDGTEVAAELKHIESNKCFQSSYESFIKGFALYYFIRPFSY